MVVLRSGGGRGRGRFALFALLMLGAHLFPVGFELRLLLGRENAHDLRVQLLARLRIGLAAFRVGLAILRHQRLNLLFLLIRQIQIRETVHHAAVVVVTESALLLGTRLGLRRSLLRAAGNRKTDRNCKRSGKEERG